LESKEIAFIEKQVLEKIKDHARRVHASTKHEVMGYLLGHFKEGRVDVTDIVIPEQESSTVGVQEKDTDTQLIKALQEEENQKLGIVNVGWYHSHPGFGCFLSHVDLVTQDVWQKVNSRMIALVIDNVSGEFKIFRVKKAKNDLLSVQIQARIMD